MTFDENSPKNHTLSGLVHAGIVLSKVLSRGLVGEKNDWMLLRENFEKLFGKHLSAHLELVDFQGSVLIMKASNSVWKTEALYQKKAIIEMCNGLLGAPRVKDIRFI